MTASLASLLGPSLPSTPEKKKRVLLIDTSRAQRDIRSEAMRRLGIEVDCAADISEARCWWRPELYDLVLFHVETELTHMNKFWDEIRGATPSQATAFLIGKPEYLAASPNGHALTSEKVSEEIMLPDGPPSLSVRDSPSVPKFWGIMEACRRISAVRSIADARSRALREKPLPRRDATDAKPHGVAVKLKIDGELHREELQ